jgi:hypothetical protein
MSMTSNVMYSVLGFCGVPNKTGKVMKPTGSILLLIKVIKMHCWLFQFLYVIAHLLKAEGKRISAWLPLSTRILVVSHLLIWMVMTMVSVCENKARLMSWAKK